MEEIDKISLIIDASILAIILFSAFSGKSKGLFRTVMSFFLWMISVTVPFFFVVPMRKFLIQNTSMDESLISHISVNTTAPLYESSFFENVAPPFKDLLNENECISENHIAASLANLILTIVAFLILFLAIRVITSIISFCIPGRDKNTTAGHIDGFFGFLFGVLRGLVIISLLMLILFLFFTLTGTATDGTIVNGIRQSKLGGFLYYNNPIFYIVNTL